MSEVTGRTPSQAMCELRYEGNECHRPEGHSGLCYDERTRVAFEDGWWGDDKGNSGRSASDVERLHPERPPFDGVPWADLWPSERALVTEWHLSPPARTTTPPPASPA